MREVIVQGIRAAGPLGEAVMMLKEKDGVRMIHIRIGTVEAYAISIALEQILFPRPLTHDLFLIALGKFGARLKSATITGLALNTFFATLAFAHDTGGIELDARPSDGVALALRAGAPIFAADELFELGVGGGPESPQP